MKPRINPFLRTTVIATVTLAVSASSAFAVNGWWNTGDGNWDNVNNWWTTVGGTTIVASVPTTGQTIVFNGTGVNGNQNVYLNGNRAGSTLTFANTGITSLIGGIAGTPATNSLTLSGAIAVNAGAGRVNLGVNTTATTLTLSNTDITTLSGVNSFSGAITLNSGSTLKLANADAVAGTTTGFTGPNTAISTLWLANNAAINNLKINSAGGSTITLRTIVDRATAGVAVDQSIAFTSTRGNYIFQKGSQVTSGTPLITASGTTTFGTGTNIAAAAIFNPLGVNLSFGNMAAANTGANCNNGLVLDGTSAGNKITGVISNGLSTGTLTPTITQTTIGSQTVTVSSATGITVGALLTGYSGIQSGTVVTAIAGSVLTLSQATTGSMSGATGSLNQFVNETRLIKAGSSTWALSGANTFSGITTVQGGTLNLDFSAAGAPASNILYNNFNGAATRPTVTLAGGNLQLTGKGSGANNVQTLNTLAALGSTSSKITVGGGVSGSTVTLQLATLTNNTSSLLDVSGMDANNIVNATGATGGNNARITTNNYTDFGFVDGSKNIIASGSNISTALPTSTGSTSSFYTLSGTPAALSGNTAFKGIRVSGGNGTLDLGGFQLQGVSTSNSAILYSGSSTYNIQNGTLISSSTGATEFDLYTASGSTINIASSAAINDNTGLASILTAGAGTVSVAGGKNFTGITRILGGTYSFDTLANGGTASGLGKSANLAANLIINGATVKYTGSEAAPTTDRSFTIGSNGATLDASGTNALTWAPAVALAYAANQNNYLTLTGGNTGANTFGVATGGITDGAAGFTTLTKSGTGKWVLSGINSYTGGTYINDGTLAVGSTVDASTSTATTTNGSAVVTGFSSTSSFKIGQVISGPGFSNATIRSIDSGSQITLNSNAGTGFGSGTITAQSGTSIGSTGPIVFGGGTLQYSATNTADYSKRILLSTSAIKIDTNGQAVTFASVIDSSNVGGLTLNDTAVSKGTLTLSGTNFYTGATTVTAGTLVVNGNISTSSLTTVKTGATLGGSGTVGALTIDSGGFFSPGNSPGITTVNGNYIQNGSLIAEVTGLTPGVTGHDQVIVNGTVTLNGLLSLTMNTFTPAEGDPIFLMLNDGADAVTGTFTALAQGSVWGSYGGFDWQISYLANNTGIGTGTFTGGNDVALFAVAIPEPRAALLGGLGMLMLLRRRRNA